MMEENDSKKVFLSVLGVAILIVAVVGITFAAYTFTNQNAGTNTVTTGTITMSYQEPSTAITLNDALPITAGIDDIPGLLDANEDGIAEYFAFTVAATATGTVTIPYEINIEKLTADAGKNLLPDSSVRIGLWTGTVGDENRVKNMLMSELVGEGTSSIRTNSYTLNDVSVQFNNGTATNASVNYVLRIWVDGAVDTRTPAQFPENGQYRIKVHVDAYANPIGQ